MKNSLCSEHGQKFWEAHLDEAEVPHFMYIKPFGWVLRKCLEQV
jgi:hypothetical protein